MATIKTTAYGGGGKKNEDLAGKTVYDSKTGMNVTYNDKGYVSSSARPGVANTDPYRAQSSDAVLSGGNRGSSGGSDYDKQYFTDAELENADYYRQLASSGAITWDEANQYVENIRNKYGYSGGSQGDQYNAYTGAWDRGSGWGVGLGTGGGSASGSGGSSGGSFSANDLSAYLSDMYGNYTQAQLAALESAYKQNLAELQANAEQIPKTYQAARNETAAQNDLARQSFNEFAAASGLNTGTSGQAALANSAVLQGNLADISSQEADALAENALEQQKLAIEYRNAAVQAQAEGNYQLAQALYNEYVRQDDAAMQSAQLAQSQANWQAEFDASQQQYQDSLAAQQQEYAYNLAMTMLSAGIMPDTTTLNTAGISSADAIAMRLSSLSGTSGGGSSSGPSGSSKKKSSDISGSSGSTQNVLVQMNPDYYRAFAQSVSAQLSGGKENAALGNVMSRWDELSDQQKQGIQTLLEKYGYQYNP